MANFRTHITVSTVAGLGYGTAAYVWYDVPAPVCLLAGGLCGVSGMLPDLDSGPGVPLRESLAFAAAVVSTMLADRFLNFGWTMESVILAGALVYLVIRFGAAELLKRYTVHRGMFHSIPAAIIFGEIAYLLASGDLSIRLYKAGAVLLGYLIHLALDELYSVDFARGRMQIKKSFGSAIKLFGNKLWPNVSAYGKLALFTFLAMKDQAWMAEFYHQRLEARTERWTQRIVDYSGKALNAKPGEKPGEPPPDAKQPTLGEVAQRAWVSIASSRTKGESKSPPAASPESKLATLGEAAQRAWSSLAPSTIAPESKPPTLGEMTQRAWSSLVPARTSPSPPQPEAEAAPQPPKPEESGAGKGTDPGRPWLPRWSNGRDWLNPKPGPGPASGSTFH
jgi:hypothetical protein